MAVTRARRKWVALAVLFALAGMVWETMIPGRVRMVVLVVIASFALRIVLTASGSRYDREQG